MKRLIVRKLSRLQEGQAVQGSLTGLGHTEATVEPTGSLTYEQVSQIEKEIYITRQLQQSLLPKALPDTEGQFIFAKKHFVTDQLMVTGLFLPCELLGGDIYDVVKLPDNKLALFLADVSGHGIAASFITALVKATFYRICQEEKTPSKIFEVLNRELLGIITTGDYLTSCLAILDMNTLELTIASAGHPKPQWYQANTGESVSLCESTLPLAWFDGVSFPETTIQMAPGDKLCIYSDGASEMNNPEGEMYEMDRLKESIVTASQSGQYGILDDLGFHLSDFAEGTPLGDDVSYLVLEIAPQ